MTGARPQGCVFCDAQKQVDGVENLVVRRGAHAFLILNRFPYNSGHCMVIPSRHVADPSQLDAAEAAELWDMVAQTADLLRARLGAEGVNVGLNLGRVSGGSIDHLHVHLVPRWQGDTNFMPIVAQTKVLVELLADTYTRFIAALDASSEG